MTKYHPNDTVRYSGAFVRSARLPAEIANLEETVISSKMMAGGKIELVKIQWNDGTESSVVARNIAIRGSTRDINNDLPSMA